MSATISSATQGGTVLCLIGHCGILSLTCHDQRDCTLRAPAGRFVSLFFAPPLPASPPPHTTVFPFCSPPHRRPPLCFAIPHPNSRSHAVLQSVATMTCIEVTGNSISHLLQVGCNSFPPFFLPGYRAFVSRARKSLCLHTLLVLHTRHSLHSPTHTSLTPFSCLGAHQQAWGRQQEPPAAEGAAKAG